MRIRVAQPAGTNRARAVNNLPVVIAWENPAAIACKLSPAIGAGTRRIEMIRAYKPEDFDAIASMVRELARASTGE
jgi:hypothetical protein